MELTTRLAKAVMKSFPSQPKASDISLFEVFQRREFERASPDERTKLMLDSAEFRYQRESRASFFETYFPGFDTAALRGKRVLDLGSFTGGSIVAWAERYGIGDPVGIDIDERFAEAGALYAAKKGIRARFYTGFAEAMPFADGEFDVVVSFDVFEHVRDVAKVMSECFRILKPGGTLLAAFPQYFQPAESHLGHVTRAPALQWFFSGRTLTRAYHDIIRERGDDAYWYARQDRDPEPWERSPSLNGITVRRFRKIIRSNPGWNVEHWSTRPIFSGRAARGGVYRIVNMALSGPARLPVLEEFLLGRICCRLRKRAV